MKTQWDANDETKLAQEIVGVLPAGSVVRFCSDDLESIRFAVQAAGLKLRSIVLSRASLRRLLADAARPVKVEYLQRDLLRSARRRAEFRYPRLSHFVEAVRGRRQRKAGGALSLAGITSVILR
ncbi:MAG TPA: hypothetical protein VNA04_14885 [Thermoanaerobaculia bacterium]|nr:hypothetical protein [Thermoanaerobaculia bacterium]